MRSLISGVLAASLVIASGAASANDLKKVGQTIGHATGSVGHGASKVYHEAAKGTHKVIAKNSHDPHTKAVQMHKAAYHKNRSHRQTHLTRLERKRAVRTAKQ